jgi:hypothetical protein
MAKSKGRLLSELAEAPKNEDYADVNSLPDTGNKVGDQAFVEASNRLYIWNGSGWYNIALINTAPTWDSNGQPASSYVLSADSPQTTTSITLAASDPEGLPISYTYVTGGSMDSIATVSQDSSVFTITPKTSAQAPDGGTGSITFRASDGINILPQVSSFTLNFISVIENSRYTTLLATATGTSDNNNITDSSSNNHSITVNGDAHAGTFSPYRSGGYSTRFLASLSNYVRASSAPTLGNGTWTVECWVYFDDVPTSNKHIFGQNNWTGISSHWAFFADSTKQIRFSYGSGGISVSNNVIADRTWHHICATRDTNGLITLYVDGGSVGTAAGITNNFTYNDMMIGGNSNGQYSNVKIRDCRMVVGNVITPPIGGPTEPLTAVPNTVFLALHKPYLSYDTNSTTDNVFSTVNGVVTSEAFSPYDYLEYSATDHGGSVYFDVDGDWITATGIDLSSARTIEFWYYKSTNSTALETIFSIGNGYTDNVGVSLFTRNGDFEFRVGTSIVYDSGLSLDLFDFTWHHIAIVISSSNSADLYINGSRKYSGSNVTRSNSMPISIGSSVNGLTWNNTIEMQGFISDFAIFNSAKYSGTTLTIPTSPLSSSGAELHIKGTDASIIDKSQGSNLKLVGGPTGSTTQAKFSNTKSIDFGSTSDTYVMEAPSGAGYTGEFTIEFWMYNTDITSTWQSLITNSYVTGSYYFRLYKQTGNGQFALYHNSTSARLSSIGNIANNTWTHVAIVRDSSNDITVYQDGSSIGSYNNSDVFGTASNPINIGKGGVGDSTNYPMSGYIQDLRITNGLARYTANFTPPTASLEG